MILRRTGFSCPTRIQGLKSRVHYSTILTQHLNTHYRPNNFKETNSTSSFDSHLPQSTQIKPLIQYRYYQSTISTQSSTADNQTPFYGNPRPLEDSNPNLPNSPLSKLFLTIHHATTAFLNPERGDAVAALGEITGTVAVQNMMEKMQASETGREILKDRPLVDTTSGGIDLEALRNYPDGSFGKAYATFMSHHGFDPDERSPIKYMNDPDQSYVMLRYRQCHDFFHVLTGLPPTVLGELGLKWVELFQMGLPSAALSCTVGSLRLKEEERRVLMDVYLPWATKVGNEAEFLLNVYYEREFETDLNELRRRLGIVPAPRI